MPTLLPLQALFKEIDVGSYRSTGQHTGEISIERWNAYMQETHNTMELEKPGSGDMWIHTLMDEFRKVSMTTEEKDRKETEDTARYQELLQSAEALYRAISDTNTDQDHHLPELVDKLRKREFVTVHGGDFHVFGRIEAANDQDLKSITLEQWLEFLKTTRDAKESEVARRGNRWLRDFTRSLQRNIERAENNKHERVLFESFVLDELTDAYRLMAEHEQGGTKLESLGPDDALLSKGRIVVNYGISDTLHPRVSHLNEDKEGLVSLGEWLRYAKQVHEEMEHDHLCEGDLMCQSMVEKLKKALMSPEDYIEMEKEEAATFDRLLHAGVEAFAMMAEHLRNKMDHRVLHKVVLEFLATELHLHTENRQLQKHAAGQRVQWEGKHYFIQPRSSHQRDLSNGCGRRSRSSSASRSHRGGGGRDI